MGTRFGLRVSGITATIACGLLVACGGGGGGGGGTPPTAAPIATPTLAPATQSTVAPVAPAGGTVGLGGISAGSSNVVSTANVTVPAYTGASSVNTTITMQATLPTGATTPAYRAIKGHETIPYTNINPLAYFVLQVSANITITQSPGFSVTAPSALSGNFFVAVFDVNHASNGWNLVAGPVSPVGSTVTFPPATIPSGPFTLVTGDTYVFALFSATATPTPPPSPTPTPTPTTAPTATPTPGPTPAVGAASPLPIITDPTNNGYAPYDVALAFKYLVQNGYNGQGMTVAIIGDMPPATTDLTTYANVFKLPGWSLNQYSVVTVTGSQNIGPDPGGQGEAALDVETVMGLAPGANIVFYNTRGDLSNAAFLAAEQQVAATNGGKGPEVFSISFGGCENYPSPQPTPPDAAVFAGMNASGTAVTVSSGDEGDNCTTGATPPTVFGEDYPGSDPSVISVGGTNTNPASNSINSPVAWNDLNYCSGQCATGGGVSAIFPIPSYQSNVTGKFSMTKRNTPDVALPGEGVFVVLNGSYKHFAGTSWSAPEMAAMYAELDEYCGGGRPANPVAELYKAYANNAANFLDVTSGNNKWNATDSVVTYSAAVGYDNVSGLGEPYASSVATAMCPSKVWTSRPAAYSAQSLARESYGEMRDTVLPFAQRFSDVTDLGTRNADQSTSVMLVLRNTATMLSDQRTVISSLESAGFNVTMTSANGSLVQVSGPASAVNRYFRTSLHNVSQRNYGVRYANATALTLPAAIAPYVSTVYADNMVARVPLHREMR